MIDGVFTGICADCVCTMIGFCATGICVEGSCAIGICVKGLCAVGNCTEGFCDIGFCTETSCTEGFAFSMAGAMATVSRGSRFSRGTRGTRGSRTSRGSRETVGCNSVETEAFIVIYGKFTGDCADFVCTKRGFCATGVCVEDACATGICAVAVGNCTEGFCGVSICTEASCTEGFVFSMADAMAGVSSDSRGSREAVGCRGV